MENRKQIVKIVKAPEYANIEYKNIIVMIVKVVEYVFMINIKECV